MLKPVNITIDWKLALKATDALDPRNYQKLGGDWPGVYLHLIYGNASQVLGSYIGKHRTSVASRQFEHLAAYAAGNYKILDVNGNVVFSGDKALPANYDVILGDHLSRTKILFGEIIAPNPAYGGVWADASEAILQRSPNWSNNGGIHLNFRKESPIYQMFDRFQLNHTGDKCALSVFGRATIWDRKTKIVT